jgi:hypothetical protein
LARKAIAATLASVVLFTVLLIADATVMSAQDNLASSAQTSYIESRELLLEQSLAGTVSLQALAQVQAYLTSNLADCGSLPQYLESISASGSASGEDSGIAYSANATATEEPTGSLQAVQADNLTVVAPFSGEVPGALNLVTVLSVKEVGGGGSVSLERHETHVLNLPISPDSASSLCASTLGSLAATLSRSPCNATLSQEAFDASLPELVDEAAAQGFSLTAGWGSSGGGACSVTYWVTLVEPGIVGVTGSFDWTVQGSGTTA